MMVMHIGRGSKEYNDQVKGYPYSVEKAKELLKKAGYSDTNKPSVTLTYQAKDVDLYVAVQGYLQAAGFDVKLDAVDSTVYADRIVVGRSAPYQSVAQWIAPTKMEQWTRYFTEKPTTMVANVLDLKAAGVLDTYKDIMFTTDSAKQKEAAMKLQKLIVDDYCLFCPLYISQNLVAGTAKVQNSGIGMTYISTWTPEATKLAK
jgi:peptide/nickel transport system substrate-binding protein